MTTSANALVVRDDVGVDESVDVDNEYAGVGQMFNRVYNPGTGGVGTSLCTGSLINPRTVIFAQHCTGGQLDESYGPGEANHMGFGFDPTDTFTGFDTWRRNGNLANPIQSPLTGNWRSYEDLDFYNVLQVQSVFNVTEAFPGGDISIATLDTPAANLPTYGMLFSPLSGPTHGVVNGYGTTGTGSAGDNVPIDFKRRIGENMIDGLFSQNDFLAAEFGVPGFGFGDPASAQLLYHIDFDRPDRTPGDCQRGEFFGTGNGNDIVCNTGPFAGAFTLDGSSGVLIGDHMNWYGGDALANEAGTAGGDSGSALFADQIYSRPLITSVLSGGWINGVGSPLGGYGDVSYYTPLFLYTDWLVENNPYVYASARNGNRNWSNPAHWVQNMDPNYFYIDAAGRVRNGLPNGAEPGYFADDPKWGTVFDTDVSGGYGDEGPDQYYCEIDTSAPCPPGVSASGLASNGLVQLEHGGGGHHGPSDPLAAGGPGSSTTGETASNGSPTGPGSRGFVPNNSWGTYGTWDGAEDGTARFFDVTLNNIGVTTLDISVEIDNLAVSGFLSALDVRSGRTLNSLVAVDQFRGFVNVDGAINTREYMLWGGALTGRGAITAQTLYNINGVLSAGSLDGIGSMTLNGDYVQSSHGALVVNVRRQGHTITNDFIEVNGQASLDGDVLIAPVNSASRPRYQDVYTVMHADAVIGEFDDVNLLTVGPSLYGDTVVRSNGNVDIVVKARSLAHLFGPHHRFHSLGQALDNLRWGNYGSFQGLFDVVDGATFATFDRAIFGIAPGNSFETVPLAVQYSQGFTMNLNARSAELRAGVRGLSERSVLAGLRIAQAGANGERGGAGFSESLNNADRGDDRVGFFIAGQGNLTAIGNEEYQDGRYNPAAISAFSSADMTAGVDYRVNEGFAIGVSTTVSRFLTRGADNQTSPMDHTGYGVMAYATAWDGPWNFDTYLGVASHDYAMARVPGADFGNEVESLAGAVQSLAGIRAGYTFEPIAGFTFGPTIAVNYSSLDLDGYQEMGGTEFALAVEGRTLNSITVESAIQFAYAPFDNGAAAPLSAYGRLGVVNEFGDGVDMVSASFLAAPEVGFDIGRELDRQWITAAGGLAYQFSDAMSFNLEAATDSGRGELSNTSVQAGFSLRF